MHEIFGRLAARGHEVTLLASGWKGAPRTERVDEIDVVRAGSRYTFPIHARRAFGGLASRGYDVVVEDINKLPLFTPRWTALPVVALVPHLFGTTAFRQEAAPVAATVWLAEKSMRRVYRDVPFVAISRSTADDLERRGFASSHIRVSYPGVDHGLYRPDPAAEEFEEPTFVYVGRLKRYKGLEMPLRALAHVRERLSGARLLLAGEGDDRGRLERIAADSGISAGVQFLGFVSAERKLELMRRAWALVYPSPKEGWGLTNVEAAACGTPAIASDSPGLRESVVDGASGLLVPHGDATAWAEAMAAVCMDPELRARLSEGALAHAATFSWERAADEMEQTLDTVREAAVRASP